jgi:hypothetical protein
VIAPGTGRAALPARHGHDGEPGQDWFPAAGGRVGDDHGRPLADLVGKIRAASGRAGDHAGGVSDALSAAHNVAATLHV